ncbi:MAG: M28 family peptidase [Bacteroidales bacterium]
MPFTCDVNSIRRAVAAAGLAVVALVVGSTIVGAGKAQDRGGERPAPSAPALDKRLPPRADHVYTVLAKAFSPDRAMETVDAMSRSGWRLAGNPAYESSQDLVSRSLGEAGFARSSEPGSVKGVGSQWYEEYPLTNPAWEPISAKITLDDGTVALDASRAVDRVSLCINSFSTPDGGTTAPLVFVGRGTDASDYEKAGDVRGKIVFGEADAGRLFELAVRQRGAVGVLSTATAPYTRPAETPDIVQWSGVRYDEALHAFGFKIAPRLAALLKQRLASGQVTLNVAVATRFHRRPARTLVAEIRGAVRPEERIVLVAHVQEPGSNDNASGCATLAELARSLAAGIASGSISRPARTITFLWGDEIGQSRQWLRADTSRASTVRYAFSLDMTGEDVSKTGGDFLIEKQPDPSAVWVRPSDPHSEWGSSRVTAESLKGSLLNDVHLAACLRRARDTGWVVKANPYEGGSDHSVFLAAGVPALLDWHFTDRYYHTNLDTTDKTSPREMSNVGVAVGTTAWLLASADADDAKAVVGLLEDAATARLALEKRQSGEALARDHSAAARAREDAVVAAWKKWYVEAVQSVLTLSTAQPTDSLKTQIANAVQRIEKT